VPASRSARSGGSPRRSRGCERRHVAHGAKFEMPAITRRMSLPERVWAWSATTQTFLGRAILPISRSMAAATLPAISSLFAVTPGFEREYISTARPRSSSMTGTAAASAISGTVIAADSSSLVPQPVPGDVDQFIDPAEDPEVAVSGLHGPVAREVGPVAPVLAFLVLAVLRVVVSTNRSGWPQIVWKMPGQGLRMQMLPALPLPAATTSLFSS